MTTTPTDETTPQPCGAKCPHKIPTSCTEPSGHPGPHKDYGDRYPGNPSNKFRCTWKRTR